MDVVLSHTKTLPLYRILSQPEIYRNGSCGEKRIVRVVVSCAKPGSGYHLNTPLQPRTCSGEYLSGVLQNKREEFYVSVDKELKSLSDDRNASVSRMVISSGSSEACLHRRIAELTEKESRIAVQDVIYMLILYKFTEIKVHLVPKLSKCIYNRRLEIWPSKDWELESIHSFEVLQIIREHLSGVIGLKAKSSVTEYWETTHVERVQLGRMYAASILFGYFLKSACLRHHLELNLALARKELTPGYKIPLPFSDFWPSGLKRLIHNHISRNRSFSQNQEFSYQQVKHREELRCYVMGFDPETLQRCTRPKSREAAELIERHIKALFGGSIETDDPIVTSFASLKRLVLEAVAFGAFLWDAEEYVDSKFKLKET